EDVGAAVALNEPVTLGVVEPLDLACDTHRTVPALHWRKHKKRPRVRGLGLRRWPASVGGKRAVPLEKRADKPYFWTCRMRAILSVSDKSGLLDFCRGLAARGVELVSTGGTARALAEAGLPVKNVSDVTGFPEMMDGRVKTLHPKIHGGILARRHRPEDLDAIKAQGVELVDLVVVNLYPFAKAAANPETPFDELVEQIDIGGPSLLRAAGKNFRDVMVVVDPGDYPRVLEEMDRPGGASLAFHVELV